VDAPTLEEVRAAIKKLKFGRVAERNAIPPEMLKLANQPHSSSTVCQRLGYW